MRKFQLSKQKISIDTIGVQRFWFGIFIGFFSAISLSLFFNYIRESFRFLSGIHPDILILSPSEFHFYNYFFALLSSFLGLSMTIWIWMNNRHHIRRKHKMYKQLSTSLCMLVFWFTLYAIARFGNVLSFALYGASGYDDQSIFSGDQLIVIILLPLVIFLQNWFIVRLIYKVGKWMVLSFVTCLFIALCLNFTTSVDQDKLNDTYFKRFEKDYQYIDETISYAEKEYGLKFKPKTIKDLKKWQSGSSLNQVYDLKMAFESDDPVSMKTIILQQIVIRNFKKAKQLNYRNRRNWPYATPANVLKQIHLNSQNSYETKELFQILIEQIDLINTPEINWDEYEYYTETEKRKSRATRYFFPKTIKVQLNDIRDSLIKIEKYKEYTINLPEILAR
jgi:hypothetical protein